jgi:outer membrane protein
MKTSISPANPRAPPTPAARVAGRLNGRGDVGAGLNLTDFSAVQFTPAVVRALQPDSKRTSWGLAAQAGVDLPPGSGWLLNLDLKKLKLATTVCSGTATAGKFSIDPLLFSVGVGLRF